MFKPNQIYPGGRYPETIFDKLVKPFDVMKKFSESEMGFAERPG